MSQPLILSPSILLSLFLILSLSLSLSLSLARSLARFLSLFLILSFSLSLSLSLSFSFSLSLSLSHSLSLSLSFARSLSLSLLLSHSLYFHNSKCLMWLTSLRPYLNILIYPHHPTPISLSVLAKLPTRHNSTHNWMPLNHHKHQRVLSLIFPCSTSLLASLF